MNPRAGKPRVGKPRTGKPRTGKPWTGKPWTGKPRTGKPRTGQERRRAERLLRWYPADWRSRYGEEFTELLLADMSERPRSRRRNADVAPSGLVARLAAAGLTEPVPGSRDQARRSLATLGCAVAVFLAFALSMWSQLTIGWRWSRPDTPATTAAMVGMSCAMLAFCSSWPAPPSW